MKFLILTLLLSTLAFAEDSMFFSVKRYEMGQTDDDGKFLLQGPIIGNKMLLKLGSEWVELNATDERPFEALSYVSDERIYFQKDQIRFSTPIDQFGEIKNVTEFKFLNSDVTINKDIIDMDVDLFHFIMLGLEVDIHKGRIQCDPGGRFDSEIDKVCLKKINYSTVRKDGAAFTTIDIKDASESQLLDMQLRLKGVEIEGDQLSAYAPLIKGEYKGTNYNFTNVRGTCFKDPDLGELDPEKIVEGCLKTSSFHSTHFGILSDSLNGGIHSSQFDITPHRFNLKAAGATFISDGEKSELSQLEAHCFKEDIDNINIEAFRLLSGCIKDGAIKIERINVSDKEARELLSDNPVLLEQYEKRLIDFDDLKKIRLDIQEGNFRIHAKAKFIFRIGVKVTGNAELDQKNKLLKLSVDKARVMGISARKLGLKLVKKFFSSQNVQVEGNIIRIKL